MPQYGRVPCAVRTTGALQRISHPAAHVYLALATYANREGRCHPNVATLMVDCSMAHATVCRSIRELVDAGMVQRFGAPGQSASYLLTGSEIEPVSTEDQFAGTCSNQARTGSDRRPVAREDRSIPRHQPVAREDRNHIESTRKVKDSPPPTGGLFGEDELGDKAPPKRQTETDVQRVVNGCYAVVGSKPVNYKAEVKAASDLLKAFDCDVERIIAIYTRWYTDKHYGPAGLANFARYAAEVAGKMNGTPPQQGRNGSGAVEPAQVRTFAGGQRQFTEAELKEMGYGDD